MNNSYLWPQAPLMALDLTEDIVLPENHVITTGPLAPFLGPRLPTDEFIEGTFALEFTEERLRRIVSYSIVALAGKIIAFDNPSGIPEVVNSLLRKELPSVALDVRELSFGNEESLWQKTGYVHQRATAPAHPDTGQPMVVEVFFERTGSNEASVTAAAYSNFTAGGCRVSYQ